MTVPGDSTEPAQGITSWAGQRSAPGLLTGALLSFPKISAHRPGPGPIPGRKAPRAPGIPGRTFQTLLREPHAILSACIQAPPGLSPPGPGGRFQIFTLPGTNGQTPPGKTGEITRRLTAGQRRTASLNTAPSSPVGSVTAQPASPRSVQNSSRGKFQFCTKTCLRVKPQDNPKYCPGNSRHFLASSRSRPPPQTSIRAGAQREHGPPEEPGDGEKAPWWRFWSPG